MKFRTIASDLYFDLAEYIKDYLELNSEYDIKLYLGTDSQNKNDLTTYATTLVFHLGDSGCHVIFTRETVTRIPIRDYFTRLWGEVERSVNVAIYLRNNGIEVEHVGLDLNSDPKRKSHQLLAASKGYVEGYGFKARVKPDLLPAIKAADDLAR